MELLLLLLAIFLFRKMMVGRQQKTKILISCPYCEHRLGVKHPGSWRCHYCGNVFLYTVQGKVRKEEEALHVGLDGLAALFAYMCKADGVITPSELKEVETVMTSLRLSAPDRRRFKEVFNASKKYTEGDERSVLQEIRLFFGDRPELMTGVILSLESIAKLDGGITTLQQRIIDQAIDLFGTTNYSETYYHGTEQKSQQSALGSIYGANETHYQILGCTSNATDDEVKNAYKKMVQQYHPDKHMAKELPPDMLEYATNKFNEIQQAYGMIKRERNLQ